MKNLFLAGIAILGLAGTAQAYDGTHKAVDMCFRDRTAQAHDSTHKAVDTCFLSNPDAHGSTHEAVALPIPGGYTIAITTPGISQVTKNILSRTVSSAIENGVSVEFIPYEEAEKIVAWEKSSHIADLTPEVVDIKASCNTGAIKGCLSVKHNKVTISSDALSISLAAPKNSAKFGYVGAYERYIDGSARMYLVVGH